MELDSTTDITIREVEEEPDLTPLQRRVLNSLISGRNYTDSAADAGISDRTIRRWRESCPAFEHALRSQVQSIREACAVQAAASLQIAMKSLHQIAADPDNPRAIAAIRLILDLNSPLPQVRDSMGVDQVRQDQTIAVLQRFETKLH